MHTLEQLKSGELKGLARLKMSCGLREFPREIFDLADSLEILDLSGNRLADLPDDFDKLTRLRIAFFSDNEFSVFPKVLGRCHALSMIGFKSNRIDVVPADSFPTGLRWLILTNNRITELPAAIGACPLLQKVMLAGNALASLPEAMSKCKNLELLRLSANCFDQFPEWLFSMPKLTWLALGGNPATAAPAFGGSLERVPWDQLVVEERLGEGASGVISKATRAGSAVAVKVFKGSVTSDGLAADEMLACTAAGLHPNLVRVEGQIVGHPENKEGLIFSLIPPGYSNLGGPPSFDTCTRDTFCEGTTFKIRFVLQVAKGMASAMAHLHAKGLLHGDLYAHNILVREDGDPLFGDFGAAFFDFGAHTESLQKMEVRAYGCLLDDLLGRTEEQDAAIFATLSQLRDACLQDAMEKRPGFPDIEKALDGLI